MEKEREMGRLGGERKTEGDREVNGEYRCQESHKQPY